MSNIEIQRPTQTYSGAITIAVGAATGSRASTADLPIFSNSNILGYSISAGAIAGTLTLDRAGAAGVQSITATTSANVAGVNLVIVVYWTNQTTVAPVPATFVQA